MALAVSPTSYFYLSNAFAGASYPLAVITSNIDRGLCVAAKDSSSLTWQFLTAPDPTKYNICTRYVDRTFCLDVLGNDKTVPHLSTPALTSGQQWTAVPSTGGTFKFYNEFSGSSYFLDAYSVTKVAVMTQGDLTGQYWSLNPAAEQPSSSSTTPVVVKSSTTSMKSTSTSSLGTLTFSTSTTLAKEASIPTTPAVADTKGTETGISKDAKLGMEVGLGVGIPAIVIAILVWLFPRKGRW